MINKPITRLGDRRLYFLDAIRVFGAITVHLGHLYLFSLALLPTKFGIDVALTHRAVPGITAVGLFMVDTFFFTSGFLMAYTLMPVYAVSSVSGRIALTIKLIVKRWFRLAGIVIFYLLVATTGPLLASIVKATPEEAKLLRASWYGINSGCHRYWFSTLFFFNNIAPGGRGFECIGWTWYLSNEFQFFLYSLLLFTILPNPRHVAWAAFLTLIICSVWGLEYLVSLDKFHMAKAAIASVKVKWNYFFIDLYDGELGEYMTKVYSRPFLRVGPYMVGLLLGMYIMRRRKTDGDNKPSSASSFIWRHLEWFVLAGCLIIVYTPLLEEFPGFHRSMRVISPVYQSQCHILWALLLCPLYTKLYIKAHHSKLWRALSDNRWVPLSQVSYAWYHAHVIVLCVMIYHSMGTLYHRASFIEWVKGIVLTIPPTLALAYVLHRFIEEPFKRLGDRLLATTFSKKPTESRR